MKRAARPAKEGWLTTRSDVNPFRPDGAEDQRDKALIDAARGGSREALEDLVRRHQAFLHNLAVRMLCSSVDAEDATQEILVKAITKLGSFEGRSSFRTWLYRIAVHHLLNMRRDLLAYSFESYGHGLDATPDLDLPDAAQVPVDLKLLVDEARLGCTTGMLLCLDREQRLIYIIGEILGATDAIGAELLELSRDAFRQKLSRARRDLHAFMNDKCGLVNPANPCRCEKKTRAFMQAGYVDPKSLRFARERITEVRAVAERVQPALPGYDGACADVFAKHPFYEPKDVAGHLRQLLEQPEFRAHFDV
jgi:RNA polymerase sigma factor (sigma-70 family)